jgi:hypothetical protein
LALEIPSGAIPATSAPTTTARRHRRLGTSRDPAAVSGLESCWLPILVFSLICASPEGGCPAGFAISLLAGQATKYGQQLKAIVQVNTARGVLTSDSGTEWMTAVQGSFSAMTRSA